MASRGRSSGLPDFETPLREADLREHSRLTLTKADGLMREQRLFESGEAFYRGAVERAAANRLAVIADCPNKPVALQAVPAQKTESIKDQVIASMSKRERGVALALAQMSEAEFDAMLEKYLETASDKKAFNRAVAAAAGPSVAASCMAEIIARKSRDGGYPETFLKHFGKPARFMQNANRPVFRVLVPKYHASART